MATILLTLDGSSFAEQAIPQALAHCGPQDELLLVRVVDPAPSWLAPEALLADVDVTEAQTYLETIAERLRQEGRHVRTELSVGIPTQNIVACADRARADLVVMASHGRTGWKRWLLGSVVEYVARHVSCPLWVVRCPPPQATCDQAPTVKKVLVPMDVSEPSEAALGVVADWLDPATTSLVLLAAANLGWLGEEPVRQEVTADLRLALEARASQWRERGWSVKTVVDPEGAATAILDTAYAEQVDLIVLATHARTGGGRWFLGSVSEQVLRHADCPVAVVHLHTNQAA